MSQVTVNIGAIKTFYRRWTNGWTQTREATNATNNADTGASARGRNARRDNGSDFEIDRSVMIFDTSSIPANAIITSVLMYWHRHTEHNEQNSDPNLHFVKVTETGDDSGYYNQAYFQGGYLGELACYYGYPSGGGDANAWATISLAVAGITKAGNSLIGCRMGHDYNGNSDYPGNTSKENYMESETASASDKTYLIITYTTPPAVTTGSATNKGVNTVTLAGNVTDAGGGTVAERGIVYGLSADPTTADGKKMVAGTTGAYTGDITGLAGSTKYHYRAYVITENSTQYGADADFTTLPACETGAMTNLGVGSATANGNVTSVGSEITERGFVWGTATAPTTANNKVVVAGTTGAMSSFITAMPIGRRVYLRTFATNVTDTVYGNEINFIMVGGASMFSPL